MFDKSIFRGLPTLIFTGLGALTGAAFGLFAGFAFWLFGADFAAVWLFVTLFCTASGFVCGLLMEALD